MNTTPGYARYLPFAALVALTLLFALPTLLNPAFYSHDEWQKVDEITRWGMGDYLRRYAILPATASEFGVPVRPVAFIIQGLVAPYMPVAPFLVHLFDVLMHATAVCLLYTVILRLSGDRHWAFAGAVVCAVSPLAMPSMVWPAALMDRLYVLWGLAGLLAIERYVVGRGSVGWLVAAGGAAALAILSKETAMVLPAALLGWALLKPQLLRERRFWASVAAWSLPVVLFMAYRLPALLASLGQAATSPYSVSLGNVPDGLLLYFSYPFALRLTEAVNWPLVGWDWRILALLAHAILIAALGWARGWRAVAAYLFFYVILLVPVLPIAWRGAHYLYGPGLAFAAGIGFLLARVRGIGPALRWTVGAGALAGAAMHAYAIQAFAHDVGICTQQLWSSTQSAYLAAGRPKSLQFTAEPGAPGFMLHRLYTGRAQVGADYPVQLLVEGPHNPDSLQLTFDKNCTVKPRAP